MITARPWMLSFSSKQMALISRSSWKAAAERLGTAQAKIAQAPDATKGGNST